MDECVSYHTEIVFWDRLADTLGKAAKAGQAPSTIRVFFWC